MSNITLYTNDENTATGIREASFEEILDCATTCLAPMFCVDISAAGSTSLKSIDPWRIIGRYTTTPTNRRNGWSKVHDY
jgi:hypothetical protein